MKLHPMSYYWDGSQVIEVDQIIGPERFNMQCVDTAVTLAEYRYGIYEQTGPIIEWVHIPFEQLSPEFRMSLLLMGVQ